MEKRNVVKEENHNISLKLKVEKEFQEKVRKKLYIKCNFMLVATFGTTN